MGTNVGTAYVQIIPSADGITGRLKNVLSGPTASAGATAGKVGGKAMGAAMAAAAAGSAAIAGLGVLIGKSISEGAKLQQSYFGGLDTLYGDAADAARKYAREASVAGISMNTYSEQAVSFGAALKQAYGGDTTQAINAANTAILDMADNSAKMGTDITSVQEAYQGFAKGQYMLLDNLKLGYGGTKTEMERLLADAEKLSGQEYDISNLGDVYKAIHVIQEDLGLTGVAAEEASETFSGSFNAMKAAAQNFFGSLAIGENVNKSLNTLISSAGTFFFDNLVPMLGTIIKALPGAIFTLIKQAFPALLSSISGLLNNAASSLGSVANKVTSKKVTAWAKTMIPQFASAAKKVMAKFAVSLASSLPKITVAIGKIGVAIVKGLGVSLWGKVKQAANGIKTRFMAPIEAMKDKVKGIINKIKGFFPFNIGKIINLKIPSITLLTGSKTILGKTFTYPKGFDISWHKRAMANPYLFNNPTLFGAGEAGDEMLYGKKALMGDIRQAVALEQGKAGNVINATFNVNGTESPEQFAQRAAKELGRLVRMGA